jgi:hypothetical protein
MLTSSTSSFSSQVGIDYRRKLQWQLERGRARQTMIMALSDASQLERWYSQYFLPLPRAFLSIPPYVRVCGSKVR